MNCPVCGTLLPAQAKFCSQCGSPRAVPLGSTPLRPPRPPSAPNSATKWLLAGAAVVLAAAAWLALKPGALTPNGPAGSTATSDVPTDETKAAALVGPQGVPGAPVVPAGSVATSAPGTSAATPAGSTPAPAAASTSTATVVAPPPPVRPVTAPTALSVSPTAPPSTLAPTAAAKPSAAPVVSTPAVAPPPTAPRPAPKEALTLNDLLD